MSECGRCDCELPTDPDDYRIIGRDSLGVFARHWTTEDCVNALLKKTHELRKAAEWQPSKDAPQTGDKFLALWPECKSIGLLYWDIEDERFYDAADAYEEVKDFSFVWRPIPPLPKGDGG